jgi:hypothetical protein
MNALTRTTFPQMMGQLSDIVVRRFRGVCLSFHGTR